MTEMLCGCSDVPGILPVLWVMVTSVCSFSVVWVMLSLVYYHLYLFGSFGSQLQHVGSLLPLVGSFVGIHELSSFGVQALQLRCSGLVALQHVGS